MKTLIITMCLIFVLSMNVQAKDVNEPNGVDIMGITFSTYYKPTASDTTFEGWVGFRYKNSEVGIIAGYTDEFTTDGSSITLGGYGEYHFPNLRTFLEEVIWISSWLPKQIECEPSVGIAGKYNLDHKVSIVSPFIGLQFLDTFKVVTSYNIVQDNTPLPDGWQIGVSKIWVLKKTPVEVSASAGKDVSLALCWKY